MNIKIEHGGSAVYLLKLKGKVIYVGQSYNVLGRFAGHIDKSFDEVEILWMPKRLRFKEEKKLINLHAPRFNKIRKKAKRQQYEPTVTVRISEDLYREIKEFTSANGFKMNAWVTSKLLEAAKQEQSK